MRFLPVSTTLAGVVASLLIGCTPATTGGVANTPGVVEKNLGLASSYDISDLGRATFQRYQYVVEREYPAPQIRMETMWRERQPFADEGNNGITSARSRIILVARPSNRAVSGAGQLYDVTMSVESQIRGAGTDWVPAVMTPALSAYVTDMISYLEGRLRTTTRRFGVPPRA